TVFGLAMPVDAHHMRVRQIRCRFSFMHETFNSLIIDQQFFAQNLDRQNALKVFVKNFVNLPGPAPPDLPEHLEMVCEIDVQGSRCGTDYFAQRLYAWKILCAVQCLSDRTIYFAV